jgi:hypothetical protein
MHYIVKYIYILMLGKCFSEICVSRRFTSDFGQKFERSLPTCKTSKIISLNTCFDVRRRFLLSCSREEEDQMNGGVTN